jgi:acyl CoA:acetate/3-ketoacid CoA transferase beta subunit
LTAKGVVDVLITDLAVFHFRRGRMTLVRLLPGVSVEQVRECTEAEFDLDLM